MNNYDLLIKNGLIVNENSITKADLAIANGKIIEVSLPISTDKKANKVVDADGLYIFPGLIDTHVHINEPGRTNWEGYATGTKSLAAGGVTTFFDMPLNSNPPTITPLDFEKKKQLAEEKAIINFKLWGGLVPTNINELSALKECGVIGFKAFMSASGIDEFQFSNDVALFNGMKEIAKLNSLLAVHAESNVVTQQLTKECVEKGDTTAKAFSNARPIDSEIEAVNRILSYAKIIGCKVHIVHASSSKVVQVIQEWKKKGVDVSVETCPHYLSLSIDDLEQIGAVAKCAPPLREKQEIESLWESVANGEIDVIGSDHSPCPTEMKKGNLFEAWGGISGAQSTLNILLEEGYWERNVPLTTIAKISSSNPARRFGLFPQKGIISVGSDADLTIVDINQSFTLNKEDLYYKHPHSPYIGKKFRGKIMETYVNGELVFQQKQAEEAK
ncbi:allantoinase [Bacillus sp. 03113]|uniref:allantoinase n=1 Tax=Bacillus sp. 03113 TaxID=2578211 RepID=UPI0011449993|nr:allantoinase [Bacillus sp. 03113]